MTLQAYIDLYWRSMSAFAAHLGISVSSVSMWATGVRRVPMARCLQIEELTGGLVRRETLRPDVTWKRPVHR